MTHDLKKLFTTIILSTAILVGWQYFYESPKQAQIAKISQERKKQQAIIATQSTNINIENNESVDQENSNYPTIEIDSKTLSGSISLKGLRFDNLSLNEYKETLEPTSNDVTLFTKKSKLDSYFVEFGWSSADKQNSTPDKNTIWNADKTHLKAGEDINFSWKNDSGVIYKVNIALDQDYMFKITQTVDNKSSNPISLTPYGLIYRSSKPKEKPAMVFHEGALGVFDDILKEVTFEDLISKKSQRFSSNNAGWIGFTDKYWLAAIIPGDYANFQTNFVGDSNDHFEKYQIDLIAPTSVVAAGESFTIKNSLFAGAKIAKLLNNYSETQNITLFDRAIDYGWFYFITKPMFLLLSYFFMFSKNFGVAILLITILVKLLMFPIANKSYKTMQRMKKLQPTILQLKEQYGSDQMRLNTEMMALYKKEKLSPLSGCLPLIIQMPVFFSLYKVIFISIEMRHAPFFGWIKDLSVPDPTSLFNLFGLINWTPPQMLMVGLWPLIMGASMYLQQKMSPPPADPVQAKVMQFLPLIFIFMFTSFPAGLMIYWSWSNILSIIQQTVINKTYKDA